MENEKISVIMAIYNCAEYLPDAIESILNQTYTDWELILCDDASIDNTYEVAKKYRDNYPDKIILIRNKENRKLSYSLNKCLKHATGKYVARMDGDDKCLPERFERQVAYLKAHPEYEETTSWKKVQIVFTNSLNSNTGKMKKAREKNIEIRVY